jgi:hypothetical protein
MPLRDDRRRRVLTEEVRQAAGVSLPRPVARPAAAAGVADDAAPPKPKHYAPAARRDRQPRLVDLLPSRILTLAGWWLSGLVVIVGLEVAYLWQPALARLTSASQAAVIDLAGHDGLANWFSALLLGTTGLAAVLVYTLRRHRVDDYHGRYRVWLWAAALFCLLSIQQTTALAALGETLTAGLLARWGLADPTRVWQIFLLSLLGLFGLRMLVEMRRSLAAGAAWSAAALCAVLAWCLWQSQLSLGSETLNVMAAAGSQLLAHLLALTAIGLFARHVMLDAEGLIPVVRRRKLESSGRRSDRSTAAPGDARFADPPQKPKPHPPLRTDLPGGREGAGRPGGDVPLRPPASAAPPAAARPADDADEDDDSTADAQDQRLSRAERKRLKRELRRQQRG